VSSYHWLAASHGLLWLDGAVAGAAWLLGGLWLARSFVGKGECEEACFGICGQYALSLEFCPHAGRAEADRLNVRTVRGSD
jgi:hypothetical protein